MRVFDPEYAMRRIATCLPCALFVFLTACSEPGPVDPIATSYAAPQFGEVSLDPTSTHYMAFGGTGGSTYNEQCPTGAVATGASGTLARYNGTAAMYNVRLRCRTLNADGTFGSQTEIGGRGLGLGIDLRQAFQGDCPSGSMLVAASGLADGIIRSLALECRSFEGVRTSMGPWVGIGTLPGGAAPYAGSCAPGHAITGMISHAGYILDGMSFRCTAIDGLTPTATFSAPATAVPEGSSFKIGLTGADAAGAVSALTYAFDCGAGYGPPAAGDTGVVCTTSDDATPIVRGRIATLDGLGTTYAREVFVVNVAPRVAALPSDTLLTGETYSQTGSFTDPGADSWVAIIDLGPIPGVALPVVGKTFFVSRTYPTAGTFQLRVSVIDDDRGVGITTATVIVLTAAQGTRVLGSEITKLVAGGTLPKKTADALQPSLTAAAKHLDEGRTIPAHNELNAFKNKVTAAEKSKKITGAVSGSLRSSADRIIGSSSL